MDKLWVETLCQLDANGELLASRNGQSAELVGFSAKLGNVNENFLFNEIRNLSPYYACAELLWYLSMTDDSSFLQLFAPSYTRFCEDGIHAFGAYGYRWHSNLMFNDPPSVDQFSMAIKALQLHPESRQVIMTMWEADDLPHAIDLDKKDLPCTLTHQFLLRNGYLHLVTTMRSNDVWLGMPYDVFCNTQLQKLIADILGVEAGSYTHNAGSMHYYEKNFDNIDKVLKMTAKQLEVIVPASVHHVGVSELDLEKQIELAIRFVGGVRVGGFDNETQFKLAIKELQQFHSIVADAAFVCATKWKPEMKEHIVDPQLRMAVEEFKN